MSIFSKLACSIKTAFKKCDDGKSDPCCDKEIRENLSEKKIDKQISDSFPASDPPSTY